jgi:large subunit ribosomal protein L30
MFAVVRLSGTIGVKKSTEKRLEILGLKAANNCVVLPETESFRGMLQGVKDLVAYGSINLQTFTAMLKKRGRMEGGKRITDKELKEMGYKGIDDFAKTLFEGKVKMKDTRLKTFRLTPPSHGLRSVRHNYPKGEIGNQKEAINELIKRMI